MDATRSTTPVDDEVMVLWPRAAGLAVPRRRPGRRATPLTVARPRQISVELLRIADLMLVFAGLLGAFVIVNHPASLRRLGELLAMRFSTPNVISAIVIALIWQIAFSWFGLYRPLRSDDPVRSRRAVFSACIAAAILTAWLPWLTASFGQGVEHYAGFCAWMFLSAYVVHAWAPHWLRSLDTTTQQRVLIVGTGPRAVQLYHELRDLPGHEFSVVGFVDDDEHADFRGTGEEILGGIGDLERLLTQHVIDEVLVALPTKSCYTVIQRVLQDCERVGVESRYLADVFQCSLGRARYEEGIDFPSPVVALKVVCDDVRLWIKRAVDTVTALLMLIVLSPLLLLVALAIRLTSPGPILFVQQRVGWRKRHFPMFKFRTMGVDAEAQQASLEDQNEASGPVFKIREDPRITPIGRWLRRTSIDELPQLLNVLRGEMSLVGPRPIPLRDVARFDQPWFMRRFSMRPGLTCLWQVSGRSNLSFDDWIALDLRYIDEWSLALDLRLLIQTIPAVLSGTGAT